MIQKIFKVRRDVKLSRPLIHCITNPISINQCANAILATGARPIMAEHYSEVGEITPLSSALVLNLGNITDARMKAMKICADIAMKNQIPIVFDLVGVACSSFRRTFAHELLDRFSIDIIKGNYSEINAMYNNDYSSSGVDSEPSLKNDYISIVSSKLAKEHQSVILASGSTDIVTDSNTIIHINNGTKYLSSVTGTGCMLGALCGCYLSAASGISAAVASCAVMGISGSLSVDCKGIGSFMVNLMDNLSTITDSDIEKYIKLEEYKIE